MITLWIAKKCLNCTLALHGKNKIIFQFCNNVPITFFYHLPKSFGHNPKDSFKKANYVRVTQNMKN